MGDVCDDLGPKAIQYLIQRIMEECFEIDSKGKLAAETAAPNTHSHTLTQCKLEVIVHNAVKVE